MSTYVQEQRQARRGREAQLKDLWPLDMNVHEYSICYVVAAMGRKSTLTLARFLPKAYY